MPGLAQRIAAAVAGHGAAKEKGKAEEGAATSSRSMDAPYLAVPVVRDGRLVNYLFVSIRIEIAPAVDLWRTRERAQFLRDALVRASHANDLADPHDNNALNEALAHPGVSRGRRSRPWANGRSGRSSIVATYSSQGSGI